MTSRITELFAKDLIFISLIRVLSPLKKETIKAFIETFGVKPSYVCMAPGRVNLIGEHTDYNDGFVLPTPINRYIWVAVAPRSDDLIKIYAADFDETSQFRLDNILFDSNYPWSNYVRGVANELQRLGYDIYGANISIKGNVPLEAGLSSSAALEMAIIRAFNEIYELDIRPMEMAYIGKAAENDFVGVQSGIMDQFVSGLGHYGEALFIDCRSNEYERIPLDPNYKIVIVNTMKSRELANSAYNERRIECQKAVQLFQEKIPSIKALRDVTSEQLIRYWGFLPKPIRCRSRHVISENQRVLESVEYLKKGEMDNFGDLMYDSHDSLRYDYEVSCRELDVLVELTLEMRGVIGARMTGAGFGGCTVNLIEVDSVDEFTKSIYSNYLRRTGKRPEIYLV
jgi:galactokinase